MVLVQKPDSIMGKAIDDSDVPTDTQVLTFNSTKDQWDAQDGGGGANNFMMGAHQSDIIANAATEFFAPFSAQLFSATESQRQIAAPEDFTSKNMVVSIESATHVGDVIVVLNIGGTATGQTITFGTGIGGIVTITEDVAITKDDLVGYEIDASSKSSGTFRLGSVVNWCEK